MTAFFPCLPVSPLMTRETGSHATSHGSLSSLGVHYFIYSSIAGDSYNCFHVIYESIALNVASLANPVPGSYRCHFTRKLRRQGVARKWKIFFIIRHFRQANSTFPGLIYH